ncbi:MAG: hypothetical protein ACERKO_12600, partial [Acetanaerobacterium sp.]
MNTDINATEALDNDVAEGDYDLSVSVSSDTKDVKASYKLVKSSNRDGVAIKIIIDPIAEKFTVDEPKDYEIKIKVVQTFDAESGSGDDDRHVGELTVEDGTVGNTRVDFDDVYEDASGNYSVDTEGARVVDESIFEEADGNALEVNYDDYSVKFAKVSRQNTSLYLYAKTDVVSVDSTKAIGSIGFAATRVKDAVAITMPITEDNENYYGETVYVYKIANGAPTGDAISAEVINHNSVLFDVPAGSALGTYAAYGDLQEGEAEKPAIPETGANDIVNIAIVF